MSSRSDRDLTILLLTGGHPFERAPFLELFDSLDGIHYEEAQLPAAAERFTQSSAAYDAFVFYDFKQAMPADARRALLDALGTRVGAVFLHHAIYSQIDWPEYRKVIGGYWDYVPFEVDGVTYGPSTAVIDQQLAVSIVDPSHPVTRGMCAFQLVDECYGHYYVAPSVTPLLRTDHPQSESVLGWSHHYEGAPIVYLQPGHGPSSYGDLSFRRLVQQAIRWAASRSGA
jgi:type 1 glutamine amidotransferase